MTLLSLSYLLTHAHMNCPPWQSLVLAEFPLSQLFEWGAMVGGW